VHDLELDAVGVVEEDRVVAGRVAVLLGPVSMTAPVRRSQAARSSTAARVQAAKATWCRPMP
jgi:hypothetical protein